VSTQEPAKKPWTLKRVLTQALLWAITLGLLYWVFFVKLPSEISYADVWAAVQALSATDVVILSLAGILTVIAVGWTSAAVLPGLPLRQGTQASVVGQLTSVALPPPGDLIIRFGMYRTYGFTNDRSAVAVVLAGIARYFTVVAIPLIGLVAVLLTGHGGWTQFWWLLGGSIVFLIAFVLMGKVLRNETFAHAFGRFLERVVRRLWRMFKKTPPQDLEHSVVDFSQRTRNVAVGHFRNVAVSNIAWGLSCWLVFLLSARFAGLTSEDMSASEALLITGVMLLLNAFPITPGGVGVTETIMLAIIDFPNDSVKSAFTAAMFLYRVFTWLLPFPIGAVAFFVWRWQVKTGRIKQHVPDKDDLPETA
jgi:putative heme transporter